MKYVVKKVIKGNEYYYLQYKNYSKNLGVYLSSDLKEELILFFQEVAKQEFLYFPTELKNQFRYGSIEKLEYLHHLYILLRHELFADVFDRILSQLAILFTYHSNRSEGSRVTQEQIETFKQKRIRKPRTRTDQEIYSSFQAFDFAFSEMNWNLKGIKTVHKLLLQHTDPLIAGVWKNENNVAPGNQLTTDFKRVSQEMKRLMSWLKEAFRKKMYPPQIALGFYCQFERIHPFLDGNGRVGRILLNAILNKYKYPPIIFFSENHQEHSTAIRYALEGRWGKMYKHFLNQVKKTDQVVTEFLTI